MKNLFLFISAFAIISLIACGQTNKDVPEKVKTAFAKKFSNVEKVKWSKEKDEVWEAEFKMDGKKYSANFDESGEWLEKEYEINKSEIPVAVKATIDQEFSGYKIESVEISETATGKLYEFDLESGKEEIEVAIDANGKIVKNENEEEENDEDDD